MSLFKPAQNNAAYLKAAFMGLAGSGKTFTASSLAIGMVKHMQKLGLEQGNKPVYFVDSENGASWMVRRFEEVGIPLQVASTTTFTDLAQAMTIARDEASVLIIDSITAFWVEFTETYKEVKKRKRGLEFQDWAWLKTEWRRKFTTRYLNDPVHAIMCGRMGYEYEHYVDDTGKKQIEKTGVKLKAEGELGFEPSLLVHMEREQDLGEHEISHVAHVLKDRRPDAKSLDGKSIINPTFAHFLPHIEYLNLGGRQFAFDDKASSAASIPEDERFSADTTATRRLIALEEIQAILVKHYPSTSAAEKQTKQALLVKHFRTPSWTEMEKLMPLVDLQAGYDALHRELEKEPSRYGVKAAPEPVQDEIPQFDAPATATQAEAPSAGAESGPASDAPPVPSEQAGPPDERDALLARIKAAVEKAPNITMLASVMKANKKLAADLDDDRLARLDAIYADRKAALSPPMRAG